jgi:MFS family permease
MKSVEPDQASAGSARAAGMYTFAWSTGIATGPLLFGVFETSAVYKVNILISILLWIGAALLCRVVRKRGERIPAAAVQTESPLSGESVQSLAHLGWILAGVGVFTVCIIRTMWPCHGEELGISRGNIGSSLALVSYVQAVMGLLFAHTRGWMRKALPQVFFGISGVAGLLLFAFAPAEAWYFYLAAALYGVYAANFYFLLVYFSIEDTAKAAKNVGINEFLVGIISIIAPMIGGMIVSPGHAERAFYPVIVMTAAVTFFIVIALAKAARKKQAAAE